MLDVGLIQGSLLVLPAGCPALLYKPREVSQLHLQFLLGKGGKVWMSSSCPDGRTSRARGTQVEGEFLFLQGNLPTPHL